MIKKRRKTEVEGILFVLPFVLLSVIFILYPMAKGIYNGFFDFGFGRIQFVGLKNYIKIFKDPRYLLAIKNTLLMVFTVVPMLIVLGIVIAGSVFDKAAKYVSFVRVCLYIPVISSAVVMSIIWRFLLDSQSGLLRYFYNLMGREPVNILGEAKWAMGILILLLFMMNVGQCVILYLAEMISIPKELTEALAIDGGSRGQLFRYILIPLTSKTSLLNFVTQTAAIMRAFVIIQLLTNGGPNHKTTTMMYLLYKDGFADGNFGTASALGVLMFLFSILLVVVQFRAIRTSSV